VRLKVAGQGARVYLRIEDGHVLARPAQLKDSPDQVRRFTAEHTSDNKFQRAALDGRRRVEQSQLIGAAARLNRRQSQQVNKRLLSRGLGGALVFAQPPDDDAIKPIARPAVAANRVVGIDLVAVGLGLDFDHHLGGKPGARQVGGRVDGARARILGQRFERPHNVRPEGLVGHLVAIGRAQHGDALPAGCGHTQQ